MSLLWIEKYRPKTLNEVVGNRTIVDLFKEFSKEDNMPHLIMTGTPGIGKTTIVGALINEFFTSEYLRKENVLELNASDERGVDVVRTKIKTFLQKKANSTRFLILDESDSMTSAAQHSMRKMLERYADTRFIFICNDLEKISDTIQSRCAILRLLPLDQRDLQEIVTKIAEKESLIISEDAATLIADNAEGDARQAINLLQTLSSLSNTIHVEQVQRMTSTPPAKTVQRMLNKENGLNNSLKILQQLFDDGYTAEDIAKLIFKIGKDTSNMDILEGSADLILKISTGPCFSHFYSFLMIYHSK